MDYAGDGEGCGGVERIYMTSEGKKDKGEDRKVFQNRLLNELGLFVRWEISGPNIRLIRSSFNLRLIWPAFM